MNRRRSLGTFFMVSAAFVVACASQSHPAWDETSRRAIPEREASSPATAVDCESYNQSASALLPGYQLVSIWVPIVVGVDGRVTASGAPQVYPREAYDEAASRLTETSRLAEACVFDPARVNGEPVAVRTIVRFRYSVPRS
jgi:hypothetical protein